MVAVGLKRVVFGIGAFGVPLLQQGLMHSAPLEHGRKSFAGVSCCSVEYQLLQHRG